MKITKFPLRSSTVKAFDGLERDIANLSIISVNSDFFPKSIDRHIQPHHSCRVKAIGASWSFLLQKIVKIWAQTFGYQKGGLNHTRDAKEIAKKKSVKTTRLPALFYELYK